MNVYEYEETKICVLALKDYAAKHCLTFIDEIRIKCNIRIFYVFLKLCSN